MHFILISAFDPIPTDDAQPIRYQYIADELVANGHSVDYITSDFFHLNKSKRNDTVWDKNQPNNLINLNLIQTRAYTSNVSLSRLYNHYQFGKKIYVLLNKLLKKQKPDLVITAFPPIYAGKKIAAFCLKNKISYVVDVQDLWPETFERFFPKALRSLFLSSLYANRDFTIKNASAVTCVSDVYVSKLKPLFPRQQFKVFPIGIDLTEFENNMLKVHPKNIKFQCIYIGSSENNRELETLLYVAASLLECKFVLAGKGNYQQLLKRQVADMNLPNVQFVGSPSLEELTDLCLQSDLGLLLADESSFTTLPSKAFYYMAANLPIVTNILPDELRSFQNQEINTIHYYLNGKPIQLTLTIEKTMSENMQNEADKKYDLGKIRSQTIYKEYRMYLEKLVGVHNM